MVSSSLKPMAWVASLLVTSVLLMGLSGAALAQDDAAETPAADAPAEPAAEPAADDTTATKAPEEVVGAMGLPAEQVPAELQTNFQDMVHYYRIARFDLATDFAGLVLAANPEPTQLLMLAEHKTVGISLLDEMTASDVDDLREAAKKVLTIVLQGVEIKKKDSGRIMAQLERLGKNPRAYELALRELKYSGEYVVPYALGFLADESKAELHDDIKLALVAIDRPVVYPLIIGLQTPDEPVKLTVIELLSKLGYKMALPALKALVEASGTSDPVREAAKAAIANIGGSDALAVSARTLYYDLAESLYYDKLTVVTDPRRPTTDVWHWVTGSGLNYRPVPTKAVNEVMAAHAAEAGLRAEPSAPELVALWISVEMQLKDDLRSVGADKNPWAPATVPTTEFFALSAGQQYLFDVLDRALKDDRVMVALQAIRALEDVANQGYLGAAAGAAGSPLVRALSYPDRLVRFGAALAIVAVEPKQDFIGSGNVVPVLAEAVNLESGQGVLIIDATLDNLNRLKGEFRAAGWNVADATNGNDGISKARGMARIDGILLAANVDNVPYTEVIAQLRTDFATAMVPIILLSGEAERVPFSFIKQNQKYVDQIPADAAMGAIVAKIQVLQNEAGSVALSPDISKQISLRAARELAFIATADLAFTAEAARGALMNAAAGKNEDLAEVAMDALVQMPDQEVQQHLAGIALAEGASARIQIAALSAVAKIARHIGNQLQTASVTALTARIGTETDNKIRDAIGKVLGALDLDPELASKFILEHATE